jgi:hypothetical protein
MRERVRIVDVDVRERDVDFRLPFRYGAVVLTAAPEIHVRCRVVFDDGEADGYSAELAAPKWFDKNPALGNEDNFDQLRDATLAAAAAALETMEPLTPALLSLRLKDGQEPHRRFARGNGLVDAYGVSLIDRAVVDAVCRHRALSLIDVLRQNRLGVDWALIAADMAGKDAGAWLAGLQPSQTIAVRHTVGFADPIWSADVSARPDDLPVALEEIVATDGVRFFKIKLCGDIAQDIARLATIAAFLDTLPQGYSVTLDGNEQYADALTLRAFLEEAAFRPALARLWAATLFVEQPLTRAAAFEGDIVACSAIKPIIIDESDDAYDAALRARAAGYRGISVKTCKGFYKSLLNVARAQQWSRDGSFLVSAEDLSVQAGTALAQNLALWSALGFSHAERNGHYYGRGLNGLPMPYRTAVLAAHADLYRQLPDGRDRLRISDGQIGLATSNASIGYGTTCRIEPDALRIVR